MKIGECRHLLIGLAMLLAAGLAAACKPTLKLADQQEKIDLQALIPHHFSEWLFDPSITPVMPDPRVDAFLHRLYNQTLSRTYTNNNGERIMLSIAYGGDQSDAMQLHKPEVCYPAQGFQVIKQEKGGLDINDDVIPVKRLLAVQGNRIEPITYWTTVGDEVAVDGWKWKLAQMKYALSGTIPDGLIFRVSSIQPDESAAFELQTRFVVDLLNALDAPGRIRLVGKTASARMH